MASHNSRARRTVVGVAVVLAPFLLCGGCYGAFLWIMGRPPTGDVYRPLPPGVELVDERVWCDDSEAPPEWKQGFREGICVRELRVRKVGVAPDHLARDLGTLYRAVEYRSVDIQRFVTVSEGDPSLVSLLDGEGW